MKKLITVIALFAFAAAAMAQEAVLDFTQKWTNVKSYDYQLGDYTVTIASSATINSGNASPYYLILKGKDSSVTLPAFDFDVEKIEVVGNAKGSTSVTTNVFVGSKAVSTEATGSSDGAGGAKTNEFPIAGDYQAAGKRYVVKVTNTGNCQITYIKVYKKGATAKTATTTTFGEKVDNQLFVVLSGGSFAGYPATHTPADVVGTMAYTSSNTDVATVGASGAITLTGNSGITRITATFTPDDTDSYEASSATYTLRYGVKTATTLAFAESESTAYLNGSYTLPAVTLQAEGSEIANPPITYSSSDESIARVSTDGTVTLLHSGTATITARFEETADYEEATAQLPLTVVANATAKFDSKEDSNAETPSLTKGCVTMVGQAGQSNFNISSGQYFSIHSGGTVTFSTSVGKITRVAFEFTNNQYSNLTGDGYSKQNDQTLYKGVWRGNAQSVTLISTGGLSQIKTADVVVSCVDDVTLADTAVNTDALTPALRRVSNVTVGRTLSADGAWYTLCLPFTVGASEFGVTAMAFDGMENETVMRFKSCDTMEAGQPYLVYPLRDISNPTFSEVIIEGSEAAAPSGDFAFVGTYLLKSLATDGTNLFLGSGNQLCRPQESSAELRGLRAYFQVPGSTDASKLSIEADGETLSVSEVRGLVQPDDDRIYNLQGQFVGRSATALPRGVYITGGRKFIIL